MNHELCLGCRLTRKKPPIKEEMTRLAETVLLGLKVTLIIVEVILICVMVVWIIDAFKKSLDKTLCYSPFF